MAPSGAAGDAAAEIRPKLPAGHARAKRTPSGAPSAARAVGALAADGQSPARARAVDQGPAAKGLVSGSEVEGLDLSRPEGLRRLVCAGFCTFFKPQPAADDRCGGLAEIERLVCRLRADPAAVHRLRVALAGLLASREPVSYRLDEELAVLICGGCPFLPDGGCDHRNPDLDPDRRLQPCGGYILLAALADVGAITLGQE